MICVSICGACLRLEKKSQRILTELSTTINRWLDSEIVQRVEKV